MRSQSEDRESDRQPCAHHRRRREAARARAEQDPSGRRWEDRARAM